MTKYDINAPIKYDPPSPKNNLALGKLKKAKDKIAKKIITPKINKS
jgi:hypothetical protein